MEVGMVIKPPKAKTFDYAAACKFVSHSLPKRKGIAPHTVMVNALVMAQIKALRGIPRKELLMKLGVYDLPIARRWIEVQDKVKSNHAELAHMRGWARTWLRAMLGSNLHYVDVTVYDTIGNSTETRLLMLPGTTLGLIAIRGE